ncbi:MAG: NAD(P)-binding protein [Hyphomicrobiales bacterium]|nr:NAD(P)-binding protein [Hyphomicrobiales bacterium]MDE2115319.1 NAD(P)/FAD-dependent oxidoreductase [Hyphomicrobiales bacterium]
MPRSAPWTPAKPCRHRIKPAKRKPPRPTGPAVCVARELIVTKTQVAIVGGGLAGVYAAHLLHRSGIDFVLFEARDRLGGRILTVDATGRPAEDGFDLGPSWFWPDLQPAIGRLIGELGVNQQAIGTPNKHRKRTPLFGREAAAVGLTPSKLVGVAQTG